MNYLVIEIVGYSDTVSSILTLIQIPRGVTVQDLIIWTVVYLTFGAPKVVFQNATTDTPESQTI